MYIKLILIAQICQILALSEHMYFGLNPTQNAHSKTHYHLKWVTNQTQFPIHFSMNKNFPNSSFTWKWKRVSDNSYVENLPSLNKDYIQLETDTKSELIIVNFDNKNMEQLSSYQPLPSLNNEVVQLPNNTERNIFSLAYLKDHKVKLQKSLNKNKISCIADFLISNTEVSMIEPIMKQMEKYASFKLEIKSQAKLNTNNVLKRPKFRYQQQQPLQQQNQQNAVQQQEHQPLPPLISKHQLNAYQYQQPQVPVQQFQEQQQNLFQNLHPQVQNYLNQQIPFQQVYSQDSSGLDAFQRHKAQQIRQHYVDIQNFLLQQQQQHQLNAANSFFNQLQMHQQQELLMPHASLYAHPVYMMYKHKRNLLEEEEKPMNEESATQEQQSKQEGGDSQEESISFVSETNGEDYDRNKFIKVRLTLGPVTLFRPVLSEEIVSCSLDLISVDDVNFDYKSTVYMKMPQAVMTEKIKVSITKSEKFETIRI
jgi:hypothetical protein